jgi:hypothetical protein
MHTLRRLHTTWRTMTAGQTTYPLFRHELFHWDERLGGRWRLGEVFGLLTLASLCLLPATLIMFPLGLLAYALLDEVLGLLTALPAAALVVREREARTLSLLRATPLTSLEIATGKLAGLLYLAWEGASYLVRARWLGTLLALPLLGLMLTLPDPSPLAAGRPAGWVVGGLLLVYVLFIYRPLLNLLSGGALGLAASTLASSTSRAVALAMIAAGLLSLGSGGLLFGYARLSDLGGLFSDSVLGGALAEIFIWLIPLGAVTLGRGLLVPVFLGLAVHRLERISE